METFEIEMMIKEECVDIKLEETVLVDEEETDTPLSNLNVGADKNDTHKEAENDTHEVKRTSTDDTESENFKCYMETIQQNNSEVHQSTPQHKTLLHVKIHTCDACEYKTMCKGHFSVHCVEHKDSLDVNTYYKCAYKNINQKFNFSSAHRLKTTGAQIFKCNMCEYTGCSTTIAVHQQLKHKDSSIVYKCDICSHTTKNIETLECHLSEHNASSKALLYKCDLCDFETNDRARLNSHHLKHKHMYKCYIYSFTTRGKTLLVRHRLQLGPKYAQGYICDNCSYHTQRKTYFRCHAYKHICSEILMYKCSNCIYETKNAGDFTRHLLECSVLSEAQTDKCDETIYQRELLFDKLKHNDTLGNIHECNTCGYESKEINKFLNHLLTHEGPSGMCWCNCEMCDVETLHQYRQLRHEVWEVQVNKCNICDFETSIVSKKNVEDANVQLSIPATKSS